MQQSSRAGVAIVSRLAGRIQLLAASCSSNGAGAGAGTAAAAAAAATAAAAALAGQQLDACLHFASLLAAPGSTHLQAALLLCLPQLLPLARIARSSTRRLLLDLCSSLLPSAAAQQLAPAAAGAAAATGSPATYQSALLATVISRLGDKGATLRAKALGCLEKHAQLLAVHLSSAAGGDAAQRFHPALCGRCVGVCSSCLPARMPAVAVCLPAGLTY
jgi:hypothetical protein